MASEIPNHIIQVIKDDVVLRISDYVRIDKSLTAQYSREDTVDVHVEVPDEREEEIPPNMGCHPVRKGEGTLKIFFQAEKRITTQNPVNIELCVGLEMEPLDWFRNKSKGDLVGTYVLLVGQPEMDESVILLYNKNIRPCNSDGLPL